MLDRRAVLRTAALAGVAGPLLAACGSERTGGAALRTSELVSSSAARSPGDPGAVRTAVGSMWAVASGLWEQSAGDPGNVALSPYSLVAALAMTVNGAAGATRQEMLDVLAVGSEDRLNGGLNALTRRLGRLARGKVALEAANQLFGQRGVEWERDFLDVLAREYGTGLRTVDFERATEESRAVVNAWTAERTRDRIPELLPRGSVDTLTRLVLVDALYFKAPWLEPFAKPLTTDDPFRLADGSTVDVPTMHGLVSGGYAAGDGWAAASVPFAGRELALTVVLPERDRPLDVAALPAVLAALSPETVDLALPRWTFRSELALGGALARLGMPSAFDEARADFTRMAATEPLLIDDVYHQVFVAVDERGAEAAAATAVVVGLESAPVAGQTLVVDRPFHFVIHDVDHGTPLFTGRVDDPRG
ncbi:serpin family protein [Nocardioides hungaricus]